jgi:subfamily B ATP-binding cassette protein MsbA
MNPLARFLIGYLKPYRLLLAAAAACAAVVSVLTASYAWIVKPIIDDIFIQNRWDRLWMILTAILLIGFFKGAFNYGRSYLMRYVGNRAIAEIRNDLFRILVEMPMGFYSAGGGRQRTGALISLVVNDAGMVQQVIATVIRDLFQQTLTMVFLMGLLFYLDWKLAFVAIVVVPLSYYPLSRLGKRIRRVARSGQEKIAELTHLLQETLSGIRLIKAFGTERFEADRFGHKNLEYFRKTMKTTRLSEMVPGMMEFLGSIGAAMIIGVGAYAVREGRLTPGEFFAFLGASWLMYAPVRHLAATATMIQQAIAAMERIFSMMSKTTEWAADTGRLTLKPLEREILFDRVSFRYEGVEDSALSGIELRVAKGETIALVGSSGSGKTTLVNLLLRFYDPTEGSIRIDGCDLREATLRSLRDQIGIVAQETFLFDDTVARNIAYGLAETDRDRMIEAARAAYADDFIRRLPQGYDTPIGERGLRLSGGERQRLAIARAFLRNPPILILDEATSHLDAESETAVQQALQKLFKDRTTIIIAHRLATVRYATRIVVLDQGRIAEMGRHEDLLQRSGLYRHLHELQFKS